MKVNLNWFQSKGFVGGAGLMLTAAGQAVDNFVSMSNGEAPKHDWGAVSLTFFNGLALIGIRMKFPVPGGGAQ